MTHTISIFNGQYRFLSNFFVEPDGTHVEGEYQARKVLPIAYAVEKMNPSKAKGWGKKMRGKERPDWQQVNLQIMEDLVMAKFVDHENLRELLLATRDAELAEGNNWHDEFWGVCGCPLHGNGKNHLGKILMKVREWIKEKKDEEPEGSETDD
jgi:N-glycosidase YbiA